MAVTFTSAAARRSAEWSQPRIELNAAHLRLALTTLVGAVVIALTSAGRMQTMNAQPDAVNVNAVPHAAALEPALAEAFTRVADRRFAAQQLFAFLASARESGRHVASVGELLRARATVDAIDAEGGLVVFRERAAAARTTAQGTAIRDLPVLSPGDLAAVKAAMVVRTRAELTRAILFWGALWVGAFWMLASLWRVRRFADDGVLLACAHLLTAIGFAALLSRPDPLRDTMLFVRYTQGIVAGAAVCALVSLVDLRRATFLTFSYLPLAGALLLCTLLVLFGDGPGASQAKVNLGPVQPIEAIRLLLALFLAGYFARRWELLRQVPAETLASYRLPRWIRLPRLQYVAPLVAGVAVALGFFVLQRDLGPALLVGGLFLAMYAVARNRAGLAVAGLAALVAGFVIGHQLGISTTLGARVEMWLSPWDNGVRGGDQTAEATWALATGGLAGTGLGLGDTRYLPAGHTDLVLAAVGEELGFVGLLAVAFAYVVIAVRGFRVALAARNDYAFFLAIGVTLFLVLPAAVMAAGVLGVVPLTGVVTPFLSYGGSAMVANFAALGILNAVRHDQGASAPDAPLSEAAAPARAFARPVRRLQAVLAASAVALLAVLFNVQVVAADTLVVKPHLGRQADGARRYQYNPRVLDVAATLPRGTIFDRTGLPLATSDAATLRRAHDRFAAMGVTLDDTCLDADGRCYPLGGTAFHLLGDARTRVNWSASNTSYVERDFEAALRGFDDKAVAVEVADALPPPAPGVSPRAATALRRDFSALVPLLRHRRQPGHAAVTAFLARQRDVTLTIDARLQARIAGVLARYAAKSATGRAAAVVLDVDTGDVLAIANHPVPTLDADALAAVRDDDALLDRARYGLYPPGSTFKMVTAVAALRQHNGLAREPFVCTRLPDGRTGARIPGFGVVRDDVLDKHPHGRVTLHSGMVRSCNAYFAQLAVRLGPKALADTAAALGIALTPSDSAGRLRQTLPQAAYGQGDVLATPLRMARAAAAIAGGGILREPRLDRSRPVVAAAERLLSSSDAAIVAQYLRDAVLEGTGRSLRQHPWRIAGKTGTAQVAGARSHAWFVGFAPHGSATRRIAFAVLVEHAGYGSVAAAPIAGEIVTAAAEAGLVAN